MPFELHDVYTRSEIHRQIGGSLVSYLPMRAGSVVCGCFDPSLNKRAPHEIDVGNGRDVLRGAKNVAEAQAVIPVFLKQETNQWKFMGRYRSIRFSQHPDDVRAHPDRRTDAVGVLYLETAEESEIVSGDGTITNTEGRLVLREHFRRERSPSLVATKKRIVREARGALDCEVCGLSSLKLPDEIGDSCFECHHILPLSRLQGERVTRLDDLALLCANCHRMIHGTSRVMLPNELRAILASAR